MILASIFFSGLLSAAFARNPGFSINKIVQIFENCWLAYFAMLYASRTNIKYFIDALLMAAVFNVLFAFSFQYYANIGDILMGDVVRVSGLSAAYFGTNMLVAVLFAVSFYLFSERFPVRRVVFASVLISFVFLTQIRTIWILLCAMLLFFTFIGLTYKKIRRVLILSGVSVVVFFSIVSMGWTNFEKDWLNTLYSRGNGTAYTRLELWGTAARIFKGNPVLGTGPGTFGRLYLNPRYSTPNLLRLSEMYDLGQGIDAHSVFFTCMAETGAIGILCYLALFAFMGFRAKGLLAFGNDPVAFALIVFVPVAFFSDVISDQLGLKFFWLLLGFLVGLSGNRAEHV